MTISITILAQKARPLCKVDVVLAMNNFGIIRRGIGKEVVVAVSIFFNTTLLNEATPKGGVLHFAALLGLSTHM